MRAAVLALIAAAPAAAPARRPAPPVGVITLPLPDPVVTATVAGVALRLRVVLDGRGEVALNRAAAERLPIPFEPVPSAEVGRVEVPGVAASAVLAIAGKAAPAALWSFGECCEGADGAIDAALLPFAEVRLVRPGGAGGNERTFLLRRDEDGGMAARAEAGGRAIAVQFALERPGTLATAAAGAILAKAWSGTFAGRYEPVLVAWGVSRPSRMIAFARPGALAGFRFDALRTRTGDFAGRERLPTDPPGADEILVSRRTTHQRGWPVVMIGRDRLDHCVEMRLRTRELVLAMRCDFTA